MIARACVLAVFVLSALPAQRHTTHLLGLYEFHFTFPNGPTFTDHFRIDALEAVEGQQSTYRARGVFISKAAFGEVKLTDKSRLTITKGKGGRAKATGKLAFRAEGLDITLDLEIALSAISRAVLFEKCQMVSKAWNVGAKRVNKISDEIPGTRVGTIVRKGRGGPVLLVDAAGKTTVLDVSAVKLDPKVALRARVHGAMTADGKAFKVTKLEDLR